MTKFGMKHEANELRERQTFSFITLLTQHNTTQHNARAREALPQGAKFVVKNMFILSCDEPEKGYEK